MSEQNSLCRRDFLVGAMAGAAGLAWSVRGAAAGQTGTRKVKYGVVGAGNRGRNSHLALIRRNIPEVEVAAICDITRENLQIALQSFPNARGYQDYRQMLAEEKDLDAVLVVIPNYMHAEVAVAALQAGKHVLCEKPMATHLADADRMMQAAHQANRVLQVGQQHRYHDGFAKMAELIRQGAIGDVEYIFASLFRGDWNPRSWKYTDPTTGKSTNWRFLTKTAGSALLEDGIHELDVIHWLVGSDPVHIHAQGGNNVFRDRETIDNAGLLIEFANGARLTFSYTVFTDRLPNPRVTRIMGSKAEIVLEGERAAQEIVIRPYVSSWTAQKTEAREQRIPVAPLRAEEQSIQAETGTAPNDIETYRLHKAFLKSVTAGAPVFADGKVGRDAIHISLAAECSLRTGRTISWSDEQAL